MALKIYNHKGVYLLLERLWGISVHIGIIPIFERPFVISPCSF